MQRDDVEGAHRADGEQQHGQVGAGAVAVAEPAEREQPQPRTAPVRHIGTHPCGVALPDDLTYVGQVGVSARI